MKNLAAIELTDLTKNYSVNYFHKVRGIINLNLRVEINEIFGFLGPNGAGKTTTIRTLLDFLHPNAGKATILGLDSHRDSISIHKRIGNLPGELALYPNMTGNEILEYSARLRGGVSHEEMTRLANRLDIDLKRKMHTYSRGNKQKIGLILAMMHKPELLILDEPTSGLDPLVQNVLYELLEEVKHDGRTIFFSSHILPEVDRLCDRVAIIREGELISLETIASLKKHARRSMDIIFAEEVPLEPFKAIPEVSKAHISGNTLHVVINGNLDGLIKTAAEYTIVDMITHEVSLEEIFLSFYENRETAVKIEENEMEKSNVR